MHTMTLRVSSVISDTKHISIINRSVIISALSNLMLCHVITGEITSNQLQQVKNNKICLNK